jgi:hypothetical protein
LVHGVARLAAVTERGDWHDCATCTTPDAGLDLAFKAQLAGEWTRIALMEHASIAAFARFTLQIMSLGAPAELVERATTAMADETRHAKTCFALASAYAGHAIGPAALAVDQSLDENSLEEVVVTTILEGCIGETLAAVAAREACEHVEDPSVRAVLETISAEESQHAELAWSFVRWALERADVPLLERVQRVFKAELGHVEANYTALTEGDRRLLRYGIVPDTMLPSIRAQVMEQIVRPCYEALLANISSCREAICKRDRLDSTVNDVQLKRARRRLTRWHA